MLPLTIEAPQPLLSEFEYSSEDSKPQYLIPY